jgi:hypothetical protein
MATGHPGAAQPAKVGAAQPSATDPTHPDDVPSGARSWEAAVDWYFANLDLLKQLQREQAAQRERSLTPTTNTPGDPPLPQSPACYTTATLLPVPSAARPEAGRTVTTCTVYLGPPPGPDETRVPDVAGGGPAGGKGTVPGPEPERRFRLTPTAEVRATEGQAFTAVVASFTDRPARDGSAYTAAIDWGDGSTGAATVTADGRGGFDVVGSQTYAEAGTYTVTTRVRDASGTSAEATTRAAVADAPLMATGSRFDVPAGTAFTRVLATFADTNPYGLAEDFAVLIDWGDGTSGEGTIKGTGRGHFEVTGSHAYGRGGVYTITIAIRSKGGAAATARGAATVRADLTFVRGPLPVAARAGTRTGKLVLAAFTDIAPGGRPSAYTALIDWGDGVTTMGLVTARPGEFEVAGSHAYARAGSYTVAISVERPRAASLTGTTTAAVEA